MIGRTKQHLKKEWRTYLGMLVVASSIGFSAQASKANAPTADRVEGLQLSESDGSIWVTVINGGKPEWVEVRLDELTATPTAEGSPSAETATPTPIVPEASRSPTPTQVTPAAPTVTMIPLPECAGYPCDYPADHVLQVVRAVTIRTGPATFAESLRVRDVGERVYVQCVRDVIKDKSRWASEMVCNAGVMTWTAILHREVVYMEPFIKE